MAAAGALVALATAQPGTAVAASALPQFQARVERVGTSAEGRPIDVVMRGRSDASVDVLVVGVVHGTETAGIPVVRRLQRSLPPQGVRWWLVESANPDGQRRRTRHNARGVDLNRNFPHGWGSGGRPFDTFYPGPARASEPETRALLRLIRRVRPDITLWYHQHAAMVVRPPGAWRRRLARVYARRARLPLAPWPPLRGTAVAWQHAEQPLSAGLVVELPAGLLSARSVDRHERAVRALAVAASRDGVVAP